MVQLVRLATLHASWVGETDYTMLMPDMSMTVRHSKAKHNRITGRRAKQTTSQASSQAEKISKQGK